jgi:hypothetical protein
VRPVSFSCLVALGCLLPVLGACSLETRGQGEPDDGGLEAQLSEAASDTPTVQCLPGTKLCGGACVKLDDVAWGCGPASCGPACAVQNGTPKCSNGSCTIEQCKPGWADCDGKLANGCEASLHTLVNCGGCGEHCALANATVSCADGTCKLTACEPDYADCDNNDLTGCEADLRSPDSCGACGKTCTVPGGGTPSCTNGFCGISACPAGTEDCNGDPLDGCETALETLSDCGSCGNKCQLPNALAACSDGACKVAECIAPFGDCDGNAANGCEVDITSSPLHCGGCGFSCNAAHATNPACVDSLCEFACDDGFFDCNGPQTGELDDGCEAEIAVSAEHCGACGRACDATGVKTLSCAAGVCTSVCLSGGSNCLRPEAPEPDDGCETDAATSLEHCGACGAACSLENVEAPACVGGLCSPTCKTGWGDCNGPASGVADDGCEVNVLADASNCGACGKPCLLINATAATCSSGLCQYTCAQAFGDCNGPMPGALTDGCEKLTTSDINNCGGCGLACGAFHVAVNACFDSKCVPTCEPDWVDCDLSPPKPGGNNGCEANLNTSVEHCGGCGRACSGNHVDSRSCSGGKCDSSCDFSWRNCSKPSYPTPDDGCETWGAVCW